MPRGAAGNRPKQLPMAARPRVILRSAAENSAPGLAASCAMCLPVRGTFTYAPWMQTSRYEAPSTIAGALSVIAADPGAMILAGGTDLLVQYQAGVRRPTVFVDVKRIP